MSTYARFEIGGNTTHKELVTGMSKSDNPKPFAVLTLAVDSRKEGAKANFHSVIIWNENTIKYLKDRYKQGMFLIIRGEEISNQIITKQCEAEGCEQEYKLTRGYFQTNHVFDPASVVTKQGIELPIKETETKDEVVEKATA